MKDKGREMILSISCGNILTSLGGTEKVIVSHQKMFTESGIAYYYIYPVQKHIGPIRIFSYWGVILDGNFLGLFTTKEIINLLCNEKTDNSRLLKIHIHHLKNINIHELSLIVNTFDKTEIFLYIHDFYMICEQYTLINDEGRFCGTGIPCKNKCKKCHWVKRKKDSMSRRSFAEYYLDRIRFIAPSEVARNVLINSIPLFKEKVDVLYHQKMIGEYKGNCHQIQNGKNIKVAFCGLPIEIKGWSAWVTASRVACRANSAIEFYHMGKAASIEPEHMINIPVGFQNNCLTMTEALRKYKIDCVVLWSRWPETYSYVYYECMAANTFVITHKDSGNIAYQVHNNDTGLVLNDDDELTNVLIDSNSLRKKINEYHSRGCYGPEKLVENDDIIKLSRKNGQIIHPIKKSFAFNIRKNIIEKIYKQHMLKKWEIKV